MKTIFKIHTGLLVLAGMFACNEDDSLVDTPQGSPETAVTVKFSKDITADEGSGTVDIKVLLDKEATRSGTIYLSVPAGIEKYLQTKTVDGKILLLLTKGQLVSQFSMTIVDDNVHSGNLSHTFQIVEATEGFVIGDKNQITISINDNDSEPSDPAELVGLPKSYETFAGSWRSKKTYEYSSAGQVSKVYWETETPALRSGTETYYYNTNNQIVRVSSTLGFDTYFYYENDRVTRSEKVENQMIEAYSLYDYDPAGHLGGMVTYHLQENGKYSEGLTHIYLFYDNKNLYKHQVYTKDAHSEDYILLSTKTYDSYIMTHDNPFPMTEVIPGVKMQPNLPTIYRIEEGGVDISYSMSYKFHPDGYVTERTTTSSSGGEITYYEWH
ncbi:hypothetical protein JMN32_15670 [Fulvivirga sp. 29W222]|uniref:Uncharacterized protein n=1 Tax=Fulvivirga marina TaxID=2494733 RepID=A0A937FZA0_9BACT|nr:hypothetical protein [Fulvivirga marina]MBL6447757.1 hypothetical protein [Fulvivirga marina]